MMNTNDKLIKIIEFVTKRGIPLPPPGCHMQYTESPVVNNNLLLEVGVVVEHRFAFNCWCKFYQKTLSEKEYFHIQRPILVTIDWHDDIGIDSDYSNDVLELLDTGNELNVGLFSWGILRKMNDGNVLPALYHNFFSDVYVLLKQDNVYDLINTSKPNKVYSDVNNEPHSIYYFNSPSSLIKQMENLHESYYFLDMDMDYFMVDANAADPVILPESEIREFCSMDNRIFSLIKPRLIGMTLALEPTYCNGIHNSLAILDILNTGIFSGSLFSRKLSSN